MDERRAQQLRYGVAAFMGLTLLGFTYVLFDPDLGTDVPLFQEFTCRGKLTVTLTDGGDRPQLHAPEMALKMRALGNDELRPARFSIYTHADGGPWVEYFAVSVPAGEHFLYLGQITNTTEVYVSARDLEGRVCGGRSDVIGVLPAPIAGNSTRNGAQEN